MSNSFSNFASSERETGSMEHRVYKVFGCLSSVGRVAERRYRVEERRLSPGGENILRLKTKHLVPGRKVRRVPEFQRFGKSEDNPTTCLQGGYARELRTTLGRNPKWFLYPRAHVSTSPSMPAAFSIQRPHNSSSWTSGQGLHSLPRLP